MNARKNLDDTLGASLETRPAEIEPHFGIPAISRGLGISGEKARQIFTGEPGVIKICNNSPTGRRRKITMRIPKSVFTRVYRRLQSSQVTKPSKKRSRPRKATSTSAAA